MFLLKLLCAMLLCYAIVGVAKGDVHEESSSAGVSGPSVRIVLCGVAGVLAPSPHQIPPHCTEEESERQ